MLYSCKKDQMPVQLGYNEEHEKLMRGLGYFLVYKDGIDYKKDRLQNRSKSNGSEF